MHPLAKLGLSAALAALGGHHHDALVYDDSTVHDVTGHDPIGDTVVGLGDQNSPVSYDLGYHHPVADGDFGGYGSKPQPIGFGRSGHYWEPGSSGVYYEYVDGVPTGDYRNPE